MKLLGTWLAGACLSSMALATSVSFKQAIPVASVNTEDGPSTSWKTFAAAGPDGLDLRSSRDLIYIATVTISNTDYAVQLDTGSSDLWVHTPGGVPNTTNTGQSYDIQYSIGDSSGNIVIAPVTFAGFTIPKQAFVDATTASNPVLSLGAVGVLGLGFTSLSGVDSTINATGGSYGRSVLFNIFAQDPSVPNFISFLLSRNNDPQAPVEGSFTISEYDPSYTAIQNAPKISTFPLSDPTRWTVLMDGFAAGGKRFTVASSVSGVKKGQTVVLLDSGTTFTYAPESVVTAIFGGLDGAKFNTTLNQWVLPCDTEVDVSLYFAGTQYDLHPLDMVTPSTNNPSICVSSFIPQNLAVAAGQFDWLIGVNVLRSLYTVYDFGDPVSSGPTFPFVRLQQLVSAADASKDFHAVRGGVPTNGSANAAPTDGGSTTAGSTGGDTSGDKSGDTGGSGTTPLVSSDSNVNSSLTKLLNYMPAILGILGLNALILIVLVIVGCVYFTRRRRGGRRVRTSPSGGVLQLGALGGAGGGSGGAYRPVSTVTDAEAGYQRDTLYQRDDAASVHSRLSKAGSLGEGPSAPMPVSPVSASLAPPVPQYESSSLPRPPRGADMGAPQYNSMTY